MTRKPSLVPLYVALTLGSIFFLLVVSVCSAQPLVMAEMPPDGVYVLRIEDRSVISFERGIVLVPGDVPDPTPDPKPDPKPDPDPTGIEALTAISRAEYSKIPASDIKSVLGATLATVYRSAANGLRDGSLTVPAANDAVVQIRAVLPDEWAAWRQATAKTWNTLQDQGAIASPAQWAAAMDAVADGLMSEQQVLEMQADGMLNIEFIEQLIRLLVSLIDDSGQLERFIPLILVLLQLIL